MQKPPRSQPLWETIAIGISFLLLWAWYLAHQQARATFITEWIGWKALLVVAGVVLFVIMLRRMARVKRSLRGDGLPPPRLAPPSRNGHKK